MGWLREIGFTLLTTLLSVIVLFLLTKLMGSRQVSQMTMFDYVVGITIGSIAAELATELEEPLQPLTAMLGYGAAAVGIALLTDKSLKARTLLTGKPLILLDHGVIYRKNLKKARIDLSEFLTYCRMSGYFDLNQIETAVLEHNGSVSFLPKEKDRPATPEDLHLNPQQKLLQMPFVLDGILLEENIQKAGKEKNWVLRMLQQQGYRDESQVLLAIWDGRSRLEVYPLEPSGRKKQDS